MILSFLARYAIILTNRLYCARGRYMRCAFGSRYKCGVAILVASLSLLAFTPNFTHASFAVGKDAFCISNAPGWCFAMAAFSRWYYLNFQGQPPLRSVLDSKAQQRVAKELQAYYSRNLISLQADYCNRYHGNNNDSFRRLVVGLVSGEPRIVLLMNKGPRGTVLHAVLAYAWYPREKMLKVYDPNYSSEERFIDLERNEYTSLDITYNAICFPEVLQTHKGLIRKMENLLAYQVRQQQSAEAQRAAERNERGSLRRTVRLESERNSR